MKTPKSILQDIQPKSNFQDIALITTVFLTCLIAVLAFVVYKLYKRLDEISQELTGIKNEFETKTTPNAFPYGNINQTPDIDIDNNDDLTHIQMKIQEIQKEQEELSKEIPVVEEEITEIEVKKEPRKPLQNKNLAVIDED